MKNIVSKLPLVLLVFGLLVKGALVALAGFSRSPALIAVLTTYDPAAFAFANWGASLFFDPRRIAPAPGEVQIFEVLLVLGFGFECFLVGVLLRLLWGTKTDTAAAG